jgi:hypothetical protein
MTETPVTMEQDPPEEGLGDASLKLLTRAPRLRTGVLASVFRATSSSYKYYWFLALLDNLPDFNGPAPVTRIVRSMVVRAWFSVAQYRLSLGRADRLQQCVLDLQSHAALSGNESCVRIEAALDAWTECQRWTDELARFVPGRFIGAWFPQVARLHPYDRRGARDVAKASDEAWGMTIEGPYRLFDRDGVQMIEVSTTWRDWLLDNLAVVKNHTRFHLCTYLQARNPGIPGIIDKIEAPGRRILNQPRRWWRRLMDGGGLFAIDVYTGTRLHLDFDLDHFLPWTFVAHDEPWNLVPTTVAVNRSKGDSIPDMGVFLPRLARLHAEVIVTAELPPAMAGSYSKVRGPYFDRKSDAMLGSPGGNRSGRSAISTSNASHDDRRERRQSMSARAPGPSNGETASIQNIRTSMSPSF